MKPDDQAVMRRAERLLRWYPPSWRRRYQDEFRALLIADIIERPASSRRTLDIARSGMLARLAATGMVGTGPPTLERARARQATLWGSAAVFLTFGVAIWSQLSVGWQWTPPDNATTGTAMVLMTAGALSLGLTTLMMAVATGWGAIRSLSRASANRLVMPGLLVVVSAMVLVLGSQYFSGGWPGTGGHPWAARGMVPRPVASFCWALTLWITSYWAHPAALASFPHRELAWMAISPFATVGLLVGAMKIVLRVDPTPMDARIQARLGHATVGSMMMLLLGAGCWLAAGATRHRLLFHTGTIDIVSMSVMSVALIAAWYATRSYH